MTTSVSEIKAHLSGYLSLVEMEGEEIIIRKRNKPVAVVIPFSKYKEQNYSENKDKQNKKERLDRFIKKFKSIAADNKPKKHWKDILSDELIKDYESIG